MTDYRRPRHDRTKHREQVAALERILMVQGWTFDEERPAQARDHDQLGKDPIRVWQRGVDRIAIGNRYVHLYAIHPDGTKESFGAKVLSTWLSKVQRERNQARREWNP